MGTTIAAIATPMAVGGISVIRISGEEAFVIAERVFEAASGEKPSNKKGYTASYGTVFSTASSCTAGSCTASSCTASSCTASSVTSEKTVLDDCVCTVFRAPKSYTGENVVELSCHGGIYNTREVLRAVLAAGASMALPGEFTKRAFLNGKLTLTQAEAVIGIIEARSKQALNASRAQASGSLFKRINKITDELTKIAGSLAAWIDYPEEEITPIDIKELSRDLLPIEAELKSLLDTFDRGKLIFEGIDTVIAGKPNVGKSTLMNMLAGAQKSIVTEVAGTTRDVVEETVNLGEVLLRLSDTAGIRETEDTVEREGVKLAKSRLENAALALCVFDATAAPDAEDFAIIKAVKNKSAIAVINKTDLAEEINPELKSAAEESKMPIVYISAKEEKGLEKLQKAIIKEVSLDMLDLGGGILQNERQHEAALNGYRSLNEARSAILDSMTLDAIGVLLEDALASLLTLSGKSVSQTVVDEVFANFCVGK